MAQWLQDWSCMRMLQIQTSNQMQLYRFLSFDVGSCRIFSDLTAIERDIPQFTD